MPRIDDGHSTLITFALAPSVKFYEKEVTPPGMSAGGEVDTTTMHNTRWRTRSPKKLVTLTPVSLTAAYDPSVYDTIVDDLLGKNGEITIEFPDGSELDFYGWVDDFQPNALVEGEQPTAEVTIIPSNQNQSGAEVGPAFTEAPTTTTTTN